MNHRKLLLFNRILALLGLMTLASCRPWFTRQVSGEILAVEGAPEGILQGKTIRLTERTGISPGMTIRVPPGSRIDLLLLPGILIELQPDTEVEIERLRLSRDGDESIRPMIAREATIRLLRGALFATVGHAPTRSGLEIETLVGSVIAGSGRAFMTAAEGQKLRIVSARGKVAFAPLDGTPLIKIEPGYFAVLPGASATPQSAAESGAPAQKEVAETIKTESQLRQLERENQASFRRWRNRPVHPADPASEE